MDIRGFITHKLAEENTDCQDYFGINHENKKIAISDGMSQSIFPLKWAKIIVNHYLHSTNKCLSDDIRMLQTEWLDHVVAEMQRQKEKDIPTWMLENCLNERQGAGATFCGIMFEGQEWSGQVLGDSCLIEVNSDNKIVNIHRSQTGDFGNHPDFLDSFNEGRGTPKDIKGILKPGNKLLFVTDPFAEFLYLKKHEGIENVYVEQLLKICSHADFQNLVDRWRAEENMHNDDSTLVIVKYDGKDDFNVDGCTAYLDELIDMNGSKDKLEKINTSEQSVYGKDCSNEQANFMIPMGCRYCKKKHARVFITKLLKLLQYYKQNPNKK